MAPSPDDSPAATTPDGADSALDAATEHDAGFRVSLPVFDGPFDLLLNLISAHELDITEVALSRVNVSRAAVFLTEPFPPVGAAAAARLCGTPLLTLTARADAPLSRNGSTFGVVVYLYDVAPCARPLRPFVWPC